MLSLRQGAIIEKLRYRLPQHGLTWEIDVFQGENEGLIIAEIELPHEGKQFERPGWLGPELLELLRSHHVALALADGPFVGRERVIALAAHPTADFGYVRWMGPDRSIEDYSRVVVDRQQELGMWAVGLAALAARVTAVYGYFNNHFQGHSPASARALQALLGQRPVEPSVLADQTELF